MYTSCVQYVIYNVHLFTNKCRSQRLLFPSLICMNTEVSHILYIIRNDSKGGFKPGLLIFAKQIREYPEGIYDITTHRTQGN